MKKFLSSLLIALTVLIAASPVRADGESISSVTVVGATEQSGTPTPTTPIDIVSNNGVIKVSKNLFDKNKIVTGYAINASGNITENSNFGYTDLIPVEQAEYTLNNLTLGSTSWTLRIHGYSSDGTWYRQIKEVVLSSSVKQTNFSVNSTLIKYVRLSLGIVNRQNLDVLQFYPTQRPIGSIYTDGEVETIGDSANHTATVATLLGVGDYRDTQNINTGAITRNVGVKVLDGTENWSDFSSYYALSVGNIATGSILCTHFQNNSNFGIIVLSARFRAYVASIYTTLDSWKQYLADQYAAGTPVIILYSLATATTESVAGQTMTTAQVNNRTGGVTGMTITTLLSSGASVVTTIATNAIKIATTAYNSARFSPVVNDLNSTIATIRDVVTNTINQTKAIADLQATKQTRPDENCPAGKKCLLVETEENGVIVPHWYEIIENAD